MFICYVDEGSFEKDFVLFFVWNPLLAQILKKILQIFDKLDLWFLFFSKKAKF